MELTKREMETLAFIESFKAESEGLPTDKRIAHGLGISDLLTVKSYVSNLCQAGLLEYKIQPKQSSKAKETVEVNRIANKPVHKVVDAVRSGVHELSRKEIEQKAYTTDLMTARLPDGMQWEFLFTVDHQRGHDEYWQVRQHGAKARGGKYANSLLYGMFKNW
jgi:Mn-dependent DtxR family transcriptional regulator